MAQILIKATICAADQDRSARVTIEAYPVFIAEQQPCLQSEGFSVAVNYEKWAEAAKVCMWRKPASKNL